MKVEQIIFDVKLTMEEMSALRSFIGHTTPGEAVNHKVTPEDWDFVVGVYDIIHKSLEYTNDIDEQSPVKPTNKG